MEAQTKRQRMKANTEGEAFRGVRSAAPLKEARKEARGMEIGDLVVFVNDVEGLEAGRNGRVMGLCDDTVMVGCRMRERLHMVLVHTWDVLPEAMWRRLLKRREIESLRSHFGISNGQGR